MRSAVVIGMGLAALMGPALAQDAAQTLVAEESPADIRALEAAAMKDPSYCARSQKETVTYTCRFKVSAWSMCIMPTGQIALREVRGGKIVRRVLSHAGNVEARNDLNSEARVVRYSITQDGARYSVFNIDTFVDNGPDKTASGLTINEPGKAERQLTCPKTGPLQILDGHHMPTVFSNVIQRK